MLSHRLDTSAGPALSRIETGGRRGPGPLPDTHWAHFGRHPPRATPRSRTLFVTTEEELPAAHRGVGRRWSRASFNEVLVRALFDLFRSCPFSRGCERARGGGANFIFWARPHLLLCDRFVCPSS